MKKAFSVTLFFLIILITAQIQVDYIFKDAKIYTVNDKFDVVESMVIHEGKIMEVGKEKMIFKKYKSNNVISLKNKFVYPGFIDAHSHFTGYALDFWKCELWGTKSWDAILQLLVEYEKTAPTEWIYGRSWDQNNWEVKEFPNKSKLDQLFPNRPVYLKRVDGHAAIANQKALDIAGITKESFVEGGQIEIRNNELTGLLLDNAMLLVEKHIPEISEDLALSYVSKLQNTCLELGLTSLHDCGISEHMFHLLEEFQTQNLLKINVFALLEDQPTSYDKWIERGRFTNGKITFGGYKVFSDGALGSRGACLVHDYSDQPGWKGFMLKNPDDFKTLAERLFKSNLQMCTHAIGDAANKIILDIYGEILKGKNDRRWRIEHAQVIAPDDVSKFGLHSIIPSVQPTHATSDMSWVETRLGHQRLKHSYIYKDLLKQNGWLALGTDFPVEEINPIKTFYAAVFRKNEEGFPRNGFQSENALSKIEALKGMTIWAAKAAFQEHDKGSLEKGKVADFVVLDQNIMEIDEGSILKTKVLETWINGEKVFGLN